MCSNVRIPDDVFRSLKDRVDSSSAPVQPAAPVGLGGDRPLFARVGESDSVRVPFQHVYCKAGSYFVIVSLPSYHYDIDLVFTANQWGDITSDVPLYAGRGVLLKLLKGEISEAELLTALK